MAKALVITEKPSVARDIADGLGGFREEEGWFERDDLDVAIRQRGGHERVCADVGTDIIQHVS